jgi:SAM-dependent methyltransferase
MSHRRNGDRHVDSAEYLPAHRLYDACAERFARDRGGLGGEAIYLEAILVARQRGRLLDLGCGSGEPIAEHFLQAGWTVTGVDAAPAMIAIARGRLPAATWNVADMLSLSLGRRLDAIVAWGSFFHLPPADQRAMFPVFRAHAAPGAMLLVDTGPRAGEVVGDLYGRPLYHASLDSDEYRDLFDRHDFEVVRHDVDMRDADGHAVWLARHRQARPTSA